MNPDLTLDEKNNDNKIYMLLRYTDVENIDQILEKAKQAKRYLKIRNEAIIQRHKIQADRAAKLYTVLNHDVTKTFGEMLGIYHRSGHLYNIFLRILGCDDGYIEDLIDYFDQMDVTDGTVRRLIKELEKQEIVVCVRLWGLNRNISVFIHPKLMERFRLDG